MGRGPARAAALLRRGGEAVSFLWLQTVLWGAETEPPSLSLARLAQAVCFLEVPVQLRPGGGCLPHARQALRALPGGDMTGGAGTPARLLAPPPRGWPGGDQPETEEAGAAGSGSCCRQTGAGTPQLCAPSPRPAGMEWGGRRGWGAVLPRPPSASPSAGTHLAGGAGGPGSGPGCGGVRVCPRCPDPSA